METFTGEGIATANTDVDVFAPTDFDIDNWLDTLQTAGCKYAYLTAKHHNGFAMWPTAYHVEGYDPYSIAQTAWYADNGSPDVLGLFIAGCRSRNINPGIYFSIWDSTYEARSGTTQATDAASYIAMIEAQLTELLTNYGDLVAIWFDGWQWKLGYTYIPYVPIAAFVKNLQSNCLVIDNYETSHPCPTGDIDMYAHIPDDNTLLGEEVVCIKSGESWFYIEGETPNYLTATAIKNEIARCNLYNGTYLLGSFPDKTGHFPAAEATILQNVGA